MAFFLRHALLLGYNVAAAAVLFFAVAGWGQAQVAPTPVGSVLTPANYIHYTEYNLVGAKLSVKQSASPDNAGADVVRELRIEGPLTAIYVGLVELEHLGVPLELSWFGLAEVFETQEKTVLAADN